MVNYVLVWNSSFDFHVLFAGLHIVYTRDEVDIVQNLIFYIESAYKVAVSFTVFIFIKSSYTVKRIT